MSLKNTIFLCCILISYLNAQKRENYFNFMLRPGIGLNTLAKKKDGQNNGIPTNSKIGLNLSLAQVVEYNKLLNWKFAGGIELKRNQLHTVIGEIITPNTINGRGPTSIAQTYTLYYLAIPMIISFQIDKIFQTGIGLTYDYLVKSNMKISIINDTDPVLIKSGNIFYPANYSFMFYCKVSITQHSALLPTLLINTHKTKSQIFSNATGPALNFNVQYEYKI